MSDSIQQVILIGDHKQLRPKVNNFYLTVEKGEGFDLNRSLFERLVLKEYPHTQLKAQHRMRPEISALVRHLTYPDLQDAPKTQGRPNIRGIRSNVVFINHEQPEDEVEAEERIDMKSSKQNKFEVQMVLKIIRYLGQQGYGTDKLVILTPYLGQLRALMDALKKAQQIDPVLNDLDSYDVVSAGLMSESAAKSVRKSIRLATIDNYQGEESDIVIASLTRSNPDREIGFMSSPERLNVLLSRARNGLIIIGNTHTFTEARRGGQLWTKLIELLKANGNIYDGFPVVCDRHPGRRALLRTPYDFDKDCPDGGCNLPCGTMLSCKQHTCPSKCHQLADHSQMLCEQVSSAQCPTGHSMQWQCHKGPPPTCIKCERQQELAEKKQQERFALQERRDAEQRDHERQMAELEAKEAKERETIRYAQEAKERKRALEQKRMDVEATVEQARAATSPPARAPTRPEPPSPTDPPHAASEPVAPLADTPITTPQPTPTVSTSPSTRSPAAKPKTSAAKEEWERQKTLEGAVNPPIDAIMAMTGLEDVKKQVLRIKSKVDTSTRQGTDLKGERFNIAMLGNPGTGKTTVARHYAKFLASINIIPTDTFFETTGSRLANERVPGIKKQVETMLGSDGGTIFVDEAYQLTTDGEGKKVLDFILAEMENNIGKIVWIVAGYNKEMEQFFEHNPGLQSRVPYTLQFKDYEDDELLSMLEGLVEKQFGGKMKVEEGINGLYARIAIRRLGRGRGRNGFGNARALRNLFDKIRERQAERLSEERRAGNRPDDFLLLRQDLIGPDPSSVMVKSKTWKTLQSMIGLDPVKKSVQNLFDMTMLNYQRELKELQPDAISLNRVFVGSPGTGKTTVAKHYGQILAELGLISNGEVVIKNPSDFVGSALGESEANTKSILANTVGKVLIIDEAYMLYASSGAPGGTADPFKTAVIDTIVAEVQSVPGEDRCVLLLGYKDQMEEMFQNVNPGLSRRFSIENAFHFNDYSDSELLQALDWKLKSQDRTATDTAKQVAIEVLARQRQRPNFGNIGEVENLLSAAKTRYQQRQSSLQLSLRNPNAPFEPQDFDPEFDRSKDAASNLVKLFEDMVGAELIIGKLHKWQQMAKIRKAKGMDLQMIPTNFIFKGPPGVGKTTVARKMGAVYYDMGILSSKEVVECSASDLVGQYVGHTGPKTKKLFEKALGRVLFIDEAYRLGEGHFAKEAMDELVGILTHEKFRGKLIVILAGYDQEMNDLLQVNTGLTSRFPEEIVFRNIAPAKCLEILDRKLRKESVVLPALNDSSQPVNVLMIKLIERLSVLPSWGNARDMETLAQKICEVVFTREDAVVDGTLEISAEDAINCISTMLAQRQERAGNRRVAFNNVQSQPLAPSPSHYQPPAPPILRTVQTTKKMEVANQLPEEATLDQKGRDPGVSDAIWEQLQRDKQVAEEARRHSDEAMDRLEDEERTTAEQGKAIEQALQNPPEGGDDELEELKRQREAARLRELRARATREAEAKKRAEEVRVQAKLQRIGRCVAGFAWIKQADGYRCSAGGHFVTNAALGL